MAAPLSDLTRKGKPKQVLWMAECEAAFEALKRVLVSAPVLQIVDPSKAYTLQTGPNPQPMLEQMGRNTLECMPAEAYFPEKRVMPLMRRSTWPWCGLCKCSTSIDEMGSVLTALLLSADLPEGNFEWHR